MDVSQSSVALRPVGTVRSSVTDTREMPVEGVSAVLEILPEYAEGLTEIESNSHLIVLGWFGSADRSRLQVSGSRSGSGKAQPRGVFGLRSVARPNPIALKVVKLRRVVGTSLEVEGLDFVDGTPILDVKRYSPSWDCVFSSRTSRDSVYREVAAPQEVLEELVSEAVNYHGEYCQGVALGARIVQHAMATWNMPQKPADLRVWMGEDLCIFDALQALLGLTMGSRRVKIPGGRTYRLVRGDQALIYYPHDVGALSPAGILTAPMEDLFAVRHEKDYTPFEKTAEQWQRGTSLSAETEQLVTTRVQESLVHGKLPCPVAFKLSAELGVHVTQVGRAADLIKAKISSCQLGCFK